MAMIEEILGSENLTGLIQGVKSGLPVRVPEAFLTPTRAVNGNTATYQRVDGNRQLARLVQYGSKAKMRDQQDITEVPVVLMHAFESQHLPAQIMQQLKDTSESMQAVGRREIERQTRHFKSLFSNLRLAAVQMALATGKLHFDSDGHLLPSASGAFFSIDFGVTDAHRDQLNVDGSGDIIDASWSDAATSIVSHVRNIKQAAVKTSGYEIAHAFYGSNVPKYIANNTEASEYLAASTDLTRAFVESGEVPQGFLGLQWHPVGDLFFEDADGNVQEMFDPDAVVFVPEPSADWYELYEGSYLMPNALGHVHSDAASITTDLQQVHGLFSYATMSHNPVTIEQFAGDTFLPLIKVPNAVFMADVTV